MSVSKKSATMVLFFSVCFFFSACGSGPSNEGLDTLSSSSSSSGVSSGSSSSGSSLSSSSSSSSSTSSSSSGGSAPLACGEVAAQARVTGEPGNYQLNGRDVGGSYLSAINQALQSLTSGRVEQERVVVLADGSIGGNSISLPSNTILEVCGTLNSERATGKGAISAINVKNVSIPYLKMTGSPWFGLHFAGIENLHLGHIDLRLSAGLGVRFERDLPPSRKVKMDYIYVSGTDNHGVETWNIDGLDIGSVVARNTAGAGLLLNNSRNVTIDLVDGDDTGPGTGYATLRFANRNGRINNEYPTNIFVNKVISRGGARGLFCVSESGGVEINEIDFANNGSNAILLENCYNVTIHSGEIHGGGEVRIAARADEFENSRDITIANLSVFNTSVLERPCADNMNWVNLIVQGGSENICN